MYKKIWIVTQEKALLVLPYGFLFFLFLMFAAPTSKIANQAFYLFVLLPSVLSTRLLKGEALYTTLKPIVYLVVFWALFSFVGFDSGGWENVAKRFRHAFYVAAFIGTAYYLLSVGFISVEKLMIALFCLAAAYSLLSFVDFYWLHERSLGARLFPVLRLNSPIFMGIILTVYGVVIMKWFLGKGESLNVLVIFLIIIFFLYFYNSRSAVVGLFVGVLGMTIYKQKEGQKLFSIGILILFIAFLVGGYYFGNILNRGVSYRFDIWISSLMKIV